MKITAKRDKIKNIAYGSPIYEIDEYGHAMKNDPLIVLNTETGSGKNEDCVLAASLDDGGITVINDDTVVELADITITINQY